MSDEQLIVKYLDFMKEIYFHELFHAPFIRIMMDHFVLSTWDIEHPQNYNDVEEFIAEKAEELVEDGMIINLRPSGDWSLTGKARNLFGPILKL